MNNSNFREFLGIFFYWKHYLKPFGLGSAVKPGEEEGHGLNESVNQ